MESGTPIVVDEVGGGVGRHLALPTERFGILPQSLVGDVPIELPHVGHQEELLGSRPIDEDVAVAEGLHHTSPQMGSEVIMYHTDWLSSFMRTRERTTLTYSPSMVTRFTTTCGVMKRGAEMHMAW